MTRYDKVEGGSENQVLSSVIVTSYANEDSVLLSISSRLVANEHHHTFLKFSSINRRFPTTKHSQIDPLCEVTCN